MQIKRFLLTIPFVAVLASCSTKVVVYRDIFKDAKDLPDSVKEQAFINYAGYTASSTHVNTIYIISAEGGSSEPSSTTYEYTASVVKDDNNPSNNSVFYKNITKDEVRADLHYNENTHSYEGTLEDQSLNPNAYYELMRDLVFPWKGRYEVGNFETNIYDEDEKLLNAVSANATISPKNGVKTGTFSIVLKSAVTVKEAHSTTRIGHFVVSYQDFRMTSYKCVSSIYFESALYQVIITDNITTTFTY